MTHTLSAAHIQTLQTMEQQAKAGQIGFWEIYEWLAKTLKSEGVADGDQTVLWLRGAAEANANRGAMAAMIREYTQTQHKLRYGTRLKPEQMQTASDAVAQNLFNQATVGDDSQYRIAASAHGDDYLNGCGELRHAANESQFSMPEAA